MYEIGGWRMFAGRFSLLIHRGLFSISSLFFICAGITAFDAGGAFAALQSDVEAKAGTEKSKMAIVLCVASPSDERAAVMLIKSIREFGGAYKDSPVYVFQDNADENPCLMLKKMGVNLLPLEIDPSARDYLLSRKVYACSQAEKLLAGKAESLVWFDNQCLVFAPLDDLMLHNGNAVTIRPVQLLNKVGLAPDAPIDEFWGRIYKDAGVNPENVQEIEAFVDGKKIRFYINCQIISFRPELGICREWERIFTSLVKDADYQKQACPDMLHQVFLHQAVLSAVINARVNESELQWLPAACGYPLNLHEKLPPEKRLPRLNDVKYLVYDTIMQRRPDWIEIMPVEEPLKSWLENVYLESLKVTDNIYREESLCNSYLVATKDGYVMIDPGGASAPASWLQKLNKKNPVKAILITHGHEDHRTGIAAWKTGRDIPVIAQRGYVAFIRYQDRLARFNALRVARQRGTEIPADFPLKTETPVEPNVLFSDTYSYELGGLHFQTTHFGGETPDTSIIWIQEEKALCIADNYYSSFPNLYTLRGTPPRPALEYAASLDKAIALEPEYLLPGHGEPVIGKDRIKRMLTLYRDAILYVHDETVKGMNGGKDLFTLMREIKLPPELRLDEAYGRVSWSVRGIYEGYTGWFDGNVANMYDQPVSAVYPDLLELAGGAEPVVKRAKEALNKGDDIKALRLTEIVLVSLPDNKPALEVRLSALRSLSAKTGNWIESNWLNAEIKDIQAKLAQKSE
jgi:glyoxylase-like metal-dependent hydrolase (beta-lactamase superfamily II)